MDILGKRNKKDLLLIHGAWSSKNTFNYLIKNIRPNARFSTTRSSTIGKVHYCCYDNAETSLAKIVEHAQQTLDWAENPTVVIGHSMGGLVALNTHDHPAVESIVTIASPIDGININKFVQALIAYRTPVLNDLFHRSNFLNQTQQKVYTKPISCVVTTEGYNPAWYEKSDGVVTVKSQKNWLPASARVIELPYNHHEVMQTDQLCNIVKEKL